MRRINKRLLYQICIVAGLLVSLLFVMAPVTKSQGEQITYFTLYAWEEKSISKEIEDKLAQNSDTTLRPLVILKVRETETISNGDERYIADDMSNEVNKRLKISMNNEVWDSVMAQIETEIANIKFPDSSLFTRLTDRVLVPTDVVLDSVSGNLWQMAKASNRFIVSDSLHIPVLFDFEIDVNQKLFKRIFVE